MPTTLSPRRAQSRFRFDKNRDDLNPPAKSVYVFTTSSPLLHGGDCGVFGSPVVVLTGYATVPGSNKLNSVRRLDGLAGYITGRAVELSQDELARLDAFAELTGDYHRFLAQATGPATGMTFDVWVYQLREDAGSAELASSAVLEVEVELVEV